MECTFLHCNHAVFLCRLWVCHGRQPLLVRPTLWVFLLRGAGAVPRQEPALRPQENGRLEHVSESENPTIDALDINRLYWAFTSTRVHFYFSRGVILFVLVYGLYPFGEHAHLNSDLAEYEGLSLGKDFSPGKCARITNSQCQTFSACYAFFPFSVLI